MSTGRIHRRSSSGEERATPSPLLKKNGIIPSSSPYISKRRPFTSTHAQHITRTICSTLWGQKLTFHPHVRGDPPIPFSSLWPEKRTLVDTYVEAELNKHPYDLCKLLLVTNSHKSLDALMDEQVLDVGCDFGGGCGSLAHIACALGLSEVVQSLIRRSSSSNQQIWSLKDYEGNTPEGICFKPDLRKTLPSHSLFNRKHHVQGQPLKPETKKYIFELASKPEGFYKLIIMLNSYSFDVNNERNGDGDLLIHVAIKRGLPQLPVVFLLVNFHQADIRLWDRAGLTPLSLAILHEQETLAEVLVCVLGVDINERCTDDRLSPLHIAVNCKHPRIVNMLLRRGADACQEDGNGCVPSFQAKKLQANECRQIISQHLYDRTENLRQDAISGTLQVSRLYPSDLCAVCSNGCTLLMVATMHNQAMLVRELLKKGECPLDFRQMKSCDLFDSMDSMETSWCETDQDKDHSLKTAVHFAAERGNLSCLQALLNANAHPALRDGVGWLPLHYAVDRGHIECVKAILAYPNQLGLQGLKPALDISRGNEFTEITTVLEKAHERRHVELVYPLLFEVAHNGNKDLIFHVLQNGDNVNPTNEAYDWPLLLAAGFGYDELVAQLHQFGGHVAKRHQISLATPLHVAARGGHVKVVRYLLQFCHQCKDTPLPSGMMEDKDAKFVDINGRNAVGATPLELAASQGHREVVSMLLEQGASTTLPDSNGRLLNCTAFAGTQYLLEIHRKEHCLSVINALEKQSDLKTFQKCWQGPGDFNLNAENGDNMLMVAAKYARPEVLQFLLNEAAAIKPGVIIASGQSPPPPSSYTSSRSEESSDSSLPTAAHSDVIPSPSANQRPYDPERDEMERRTALPSIFRHNPPRNTREKRLTTSGGSDGGKPPRSTRYYIHATSWRHSATTTSSEDDEPPITGIPPVSASNGVGNRACAQNSENEIYEPTEIFTSLVRYCNPTDGYTCLHRASAACLPRNVSILLKADEELANMQTTEGNTALHLACSKAHKQTVQTLLSFQCVMTTARNKKKELPEHLCVKNAIKRLVCKVRQSRAGTELGLPDPPVTNWGVSASMEQTNGFIPGYNQPSGAPLSRISEASPFSSAVSDLSLSDLTNRLQRMKSEIRAAPVMEEPLNST